MLTPPNHRPEDLSTPPAKPNVRGWKRKKLILLANKCEDRQWRDYREAVYPLLLKFGCFDVPQEPASVPQSGSSTQPTSPLA